MLPNVVKLPPPLITPDNANVPPDAALILDAVPKLIAPPKLLVPEPDASYNAALVPVPFKVNAGEFE